MIKTAFVVNALAIRRREGSLSREPTHVQTAQSKEAAEFLSVR